VRGEVRLKAFTQDPLGVTRYGPLETEDGRRIEIEAARPVKDMLVARLKGVTDRDAAEALKNIRLYVAREKLPRPADDEFYHADLVGLAAVRADARRSAPSRPCTISAPAISWRSSRRLAVPR